MLKHIYILKDWVVIRITQKPLNYFFEVLSWKGIIACISMVYVGGMVTV